MQKKFDEIVKFRWFRNQTNPNSELVKAIARWGPHVNAILVVLLPVLLVILSNIMLICTLRNRYLEIFVRLQIMRF